MEGVSDETLAKLSEEDGNIDYYAREELFRESIAEIDWSVGQILDALKANGLDENTFVIFTSDNGAGRFPVKDPMPPHSGPLRGQKGTTFEGGMRVPTVIRWPGQITAGVDNDELMTAMDLLPTFAKLAGAEVPGDRVIDGKDIWPVLSQGEESPHEVFFYHRIDELLAVRAGDWKLHLELPRRGKNPGPAKSALYNLKEDIGEQNDVLQSYPDVEERLRAYAKAFEEELAQNSRPAGFVDHPKPLSMKVPQ